MTFALDVVLDKDIHESAVRGATETLSQITAHADASIVIWV